MIHLSDIKIMKEFERVEINSRAELRSWLTANHTQIESIWLVTYKKQLPDKYVPWDDIVEEVLCFGWIDSVPRRLDEERTMLLLSPRRKGSPWSRINKQRIEKLLAADLIMPPGLAAIDQAKQDGSWSIYDEVEELIMPPDLASTLSKNAAARTHFEEFSDSSKKGILWWIKSAKRDTTRQKRIDETVLLAAHNVRANHPEAKAAKQKILNSSKP